MLMLITSIIYLIYGIGSQKIHWFEVSPLKISNKKGQKPSPVVYFTGACACKLYSHFTIFLILLTIIGGCDVFFQETIRSPDPKLRCLSARAKNREWI